MPPKRSSSSKLARKLGVRIPAAALTAHARPEDRTRALEVGYDLHVAKPVDPIDLITAITSLLQHTGKSAPAGP